MAIPTYGGLAIFGPAPVLRPSASPAAFQFNEYPGVNGVEALFLGTRGGRTEVEGILVGSDRTDLDNQEAFWRTLQGSGIARVLTTDAGRAFLQVLLMEFTPSEAVRGEVSASGQVSRQYTAVFLHLI
ncbi:MAG: hypothetical protein ABI353_08540 [Isosphaeraceae bacterium]